LNSRPYYSYFMRELRRVCDTVNIYFYKLIYEAA